ncbi:fibronectin-like [Hydra vulgaris]|uniref:Fibronectin-like n=1 Tax=Hydra vulgaris TaxID=6087 RepID=A0ABM4DB97_HYDVU
MIRCVVLVVVLLFYVVGNNVSESFASINNGTNNGCTQPTYGGNTNGYCCYFPFIFAGIIYYNCTTVNSVSFWCSTTSNYDNDGLWGFCLGSEWSWSEWSAWSSCTVSCGNGTMSRTRVCFDANFCVGNAIDILSCYSNCAGSCVQTTYGGNSNDVF